MRREDMTIECQDSSRYYELNGNFGSAPAEEESKPTPVESEQPEEEEEEMEAKPVEAEPKYLLRLIIMPGALSSLTR